MGMSSPEALLQLYPKKLNKKSFNKIRSAYKKETGQDLCTVIGIAHAETITNIGKIPKGKIGDDLRVRLNKLIDYNWALNYCERARPKKRKNQ